MPRLQEMVFALVLASRLRLIVDVVLKALLVGITSDFALHKLLQLLAAAAVYAVILSTHLRQVRKEQWHEAFREYLEGCSDVFCMVLEIG